MLQSGDLVKLTPVARSEIGCYMDDTYFRVMRYVQSDAVLIEGCFSEDEYRIFVYRLEKCNAVEMMYLDSRGERQECDV